MEKLLSALFISALVGLILWLTYHQLQTLYNRNLRSYHDEIRDYLLNNSLELIEIRFPNNLDWKDECFPKPPSVSVSFSMFRINGVMARWTEKNYTIVDTVNKNEREIRVWLEVETNYFQKPKLTFKQTKRKKTLTRENPALLKNSVRVKGKCPACGWKLDNGGNSCPECELQFQ